LGNQKWQGARPSLFIAPRIIGMILIWGEMKGLKIIRAPNRIKAEPRACAIKYLIAPSVSCRDFEIIIIGINLKRLSSRLNHKRSQ
jgi:hypothetical protein